MFINQGNGERVVKKREEKKKGGKKKKKTRGRKSNEVRGRLLPTNEGGTKGGGGEGLGVRWRAGRGILMLMIL